MRPGLGRLSAKAAIFGDDLGMVHEVYDIGFYQIKTEVVVLVVFELFSVFHFSSFNRFAWFCAVDATISVLLCPLRVWACQHLTGQTLLSFRFQEWKRGHLASPRSLLWGTILDIFGFVVSNWAIGPSRPGKLGAPKRSSWPSMPVGTSKSTKDNSFWWSCF